MHFDLSLPHGANLRLASVNRVRPAPRLINGIKPGLFHDSSISFAEGICKALQIPEHA
jgi:hypothetical protein